MLQDKGVHYVLGTTRGAFATFNNRGETDFFVQRFNSDDAWTRTKHFGWFTQFGTAGTEQALTDENNEKVCMEGESFG